MRLQGRPADRLVPRLDAATRCSPGRDALVTSDHLGVPDGVNLMWNTLLPLPGLLAAPVTLTAGVLASHTLLAVAAFAGSATAMWCGRRPLGAVGPGRGSPPGCSTASRPTCVAQGSGHLNLSLVALPPLVLLLLDDLLVRQDRSPVRRGLLLGLVALAQLLTTEEVLASTFVTVAWSGWSCCVVQQRRSRPRAVRRGTPSTGLGAAAALLAVLRGLPAVGAVRRAAAA